MAKRAGKCATQQYSPGSLLMRFATPMQLLSFETNVWSFVELNHQSISEYTCFCLGRSSDKADTEPASHIDLGRSRGLGASCP